MSSSDFESWLRHFEDPAYKKLDPNKDSETLLKSNDIAQFDPNANKKLETGDWKDKKSEKPSWENEPTKTIDYQIQNHITNLERKNAEKMITNLEKPDTLWPPSWIEEDVGNTEWWKQNEWATIA